MIITEKRKKLMLRQVKKIIHSLTGKTSIDIVSELIHNSIYFNEPVFFYNFFNLQGGTIWQLAGYILLYKKEGVKIK